MTLENQQDPLSRRLLWVLPHRSGTWKTFTRGIRRDAGALGQSPGPRQSAGVSGSRACDAKQWQDRGGVAGVAAQRGGDVAVTVGAQDAMASLRNLGGVLGEGGVTG